MLRSTVLYVRVLTCRENGSLVRYPTLSTLRNMSHTPNCFPLEQLDWSCGPCRQESSLTISLSPRSCHQPTHLLGVGKLHQGLPLASVHSPFQCTFRWTRKHENEMEATGKNSLVSYTLSNDLVCNSVCMEPCHLRTGTCLDACNGCPLNECGSNT